MSQKKTFLLLIGSPKQKRSTSLSFGTYLSDRMAGKGYESEIINIHRLIKEEKGIKTLLNAINSALIIALATPLYVDCLPAPVIRLMELVSKERRLIENKEKQGMAVILNCGFPESQHNNTAVEICRIFAEKSGFRWLGGLSLGGGGAITGEKLTEAGWVARYAVKSLDMAATALAENKSIPSEAVSLMAKPSIPKWLYTALGNYGWKRQAKKLGTMARLNHRPYDES